jgi:uncharacterized protein (UPF0212 family)
MTEEPVTVRLYGTEEPIPVTVPERLVTHWDEKGSYQYVALGINVPHCPHCDGSEFQDVTCAQEVACKTCGVVVLLEDLKA